jgi:hypothetical protein
VSFAAITLYVASQRLFVIVSMYFIIDSVRKLLDTPSYVYMYRNIVKHSEAKDTCKQKSEYLVRRYAHLMVRSGVTRSMPA